jgi:outer membrane protein
MPRVVYMAALLWIAAKGVAAEALTLPAAVEHALANSTAVRSAQARADAARARADQARGLRLPSVDVAETYSGTDSPAEAFALELNQERFDKQAFFASDPNHPDWLDTWITRLEVTQPLYTGGKLSARVGQAGRMAASAMLSLRQAREETTFTTITAFTNLAKAREYEELLERARATTAEHVHLAEQYAGQGLIVEAEVLKARVYLAQVDELLATAEGAARLAEAALSFAMGADQTSHWELEPGTPPAAVQGELVSWITAALGHRHDLLAAREQLEAGRLEEKAARSALLPEIALVGRYDLYDNVPLGGHGSSGSVMGVARINVFHGGSDRAGVLAARLDTASSESGVRRFEEGVRLEVQQAWQDVATARSRQETANASLAAAREALGVREARFRQGLDRMIDLLDAETALRESEVHELVARYDLSLANYRLHFASGASLTDLILTTEEKP